MWNIFHQLTKYLCFQLSKALEQQAIMLPLFTIAKDVIPKLSIPMNTVDYYASLIDYYNGTQLARLESNAVQLYVLCYCFTRFQKLNDLLLEGFKKRVSDYHIQCQRAIEQSATAQLEKIKKARKNAGDILLAIKNAKNKTHVSKSILFRHVSEDKLVETAELLIDESLDPDILFWREVDKQCGSIKQNLRPLFLALDLVIERHEALKQAVSYLQSNINKKIPNTLPSMVKDWLSSAVKPHIFPDNILQFPRLEFWIYRQLAEQLKSNKLSLKYTLKFKPLKDDLLPDKQWKKKKKTILTSLPYSALRAKPKALLHEAKHINHMLYQQVNHAIMNGENSDVIISTDTAGQSQWRLRPLKEENPPNDSLFATFPKCSIVDVLHFVEQHLHFSKVFDSIAPKSAKHNRSPQYILAAILANALRIGTQAMGNISDLNKHTLLSVESSCIRMETLSSALQLIYDAAAQLPIFKAWNIADHYHANLDGMKLETQFAHNKARYSPKYMGLDVGVSSYNLVLNHFPMAGTIIGANEYEGHFAFELCQFQKISRRSLEVASTDKHGINSINFLLFYLTNLSFAPRIPKPHNEILWGFSPLGKYKDYIVQPTKSINENHVINNWDSMQHCITSMLMGDANASVMIQKLASSRYHSSTKLGFTHFNNILKSNFILRYIHDKDFRHAIERALNRGEAFNRLYQAIAALNKGQLRGHSELDMLIWDACTRLLAAVILYYNSIILNTLYEQATDEQVKNFLLRAVPTAWTHINLLGHYQFSGNRIPDVQSWIKAWRWEEMIKSG